ncbi:isoprenyl transferase [Exiguobacterium acetylicum]|jgi:undecaprenyl diphosphate synthase|uniref:isoprenyl transferase n=2 Tax=Bacillales Family XII. Incertae Sedis TaxID=539742 RepID=UPI000450CFC8|nr:MULTISPECIES: isoprenyl transferase [Exiguobacterium]EZP60856.1 UDP pyrophosphate synthase [Exiguobacterium sp. RIT341]KQS40090.1 UDP pyrophosphate synthase [Exiguobacterium sp. Leaf196]MDQ6467114.1 isoprenyl transferase [Exiguobacterium acetylicum]HAL01073.1 isoprenyl transferase [Exiguobacterium sp.]HCV52612.1 isoprenyl transferase [Exiguobacterium sp.]
MFQWLNQTKETETYDRVPEHVAIIMDGNGRWAQKRGLPRIMGHREGMKSIREVVRVANELGIKSLTLYAFSTENWTRPEEEVSFLMKLPAQFLESDLKELDAQNVKVEVAGEVSRLPHFTREAVEQAKLDTQHNTGLRLIFALNYGGRDELVQVMQKLGEQVQAGTLSPDAITTETIERELMTGSVTDVDFVIRTSGEQRLSNFLLWQAAYAEFYFTDVLWPEFRRNAFLAAIEDYNQRTRRFGGV